MEIYRDDQKKQIQIWLTKQESQDESLQSRLKSMYPKWKKEKYLVAVYRSGTKDLRSSTLDLLLHNKKVLAEQAAARLRETQPAPKKQIAAER